MRGNRRLDGRIVVNAGSIPACAGEPVSVSVASGSMMVYPRVCGGTVSATCGRKRRIGLSPRVRGNLVLVAFLLLLLRSIPACAGEPCWNRPATIGGTVYPRVCGGTGE